MGNATSAPEQLLFTPDDAKRAVPDRASRPRVTPTRRKAVSLTASLNTTRVSCEAVRATGAPRQHPGDRDDQYAMHGGDRVWDMTLRPDRGRRGVGNLREG